MDDSPQPVGSIGSSGNRWLWPAVAAVAGLIVGVIIGAAAAASDDDATTTAVPVQSSSLSESSAPSATVTATETVSGPATTEKVTVTAEPPKPKGTIPGDGVWLVGDDIKAGTYRGGGDGCYWARLSGTSGELDDVIANGNPEGPTVVTIKSSDVAFDTQRCGEWERIS